MAHLSNSGPPRLELNFSVTSLSIPSLESPKSFDATSLESGDSEYAEPPPNPTTSGPDSPQVYLSGWRLVVVIACLFFGALLMALDTNILNTAIPKISTEFHSLEDVAWYGTAYLLTITAFQPIYGSLYKYFTTDVVYRISIVVFEVGSILCAAAVNSNMFIAGRAIAGLGAAGILQGALSIISQVVELEKRTPLMGVVISVFIIATCLGPPLGGIFTQYATWRWCFWINLPIGGLVLIALSIFLKVNGPGNDVRSMSLKQKLKSMDPIGCLIFIGAICCLLLALQWGGQSRPWSSSTIIGLLIGSIALLCIFGVLQWKFKEKALIPLRVLGKRSVWSGAMVLFFLGASTYLNVFFLPFYFQAVKGLDPVPSGVNVIPLLASEMVALILTGACVKAWGHYVPLMIVGECICIAGTALLTQLDIATPTIKWAAYLVVSGIGMGIAMQLPYTAVQVTLLDQDIATGNAIAVLFYQLGGAIAISMGQTITISTIISEIPRQGLSIPSRAVIDAGAYNLRALATSPEVLEKLRLIWKITTMRTMILSAALVGASVPFTLAMEWLNAKKVAELRKGDSQTNLLEREKQTGKDIEAEKAEVFI